MKIITPIDHSSHSNLLDKSYEAKINNNGNNNNVTALFYQPPYY